MCTIGAVKLNRNEYILFKNKDFGQVDFDTLRIRNCWG